MASVSTSPGFQKMFSPGSAYCRSFLSEYPRPSNRHEPTTCHYWSASRSAPRTGLRGALVFRCRSAIQTSAISGRYWIPWVYLGWIAAHTRSIVLATGSIVPPLRHPLHTAKAAASVDQLSGGRLVLGVASGTGPWNFLHLAWITIPAMFSSANTCMCYGPF